MILGRRYESELLIACSFVDFGPMIARTMEGHAHDARPVESPCGPMFWEFLHQQANGLMYEVVHIQMMTTNLHTRMVIIGTFHSNDHSFVDGLNEMYAPCIPNCKRIYNGSDHSEFEVSNL